MTATGTFALSKEARNLHWLLGNLVEEVPGVRSVAVVSSDGLLLLSSDPDENAAPAAPRMLLVYSGARVTSAFKTRLWS